MRTFKTVLTAGLVLAVVTLLVGPSMAAEQEPAASPQAFTFHYGPFGPGAKLMGPAPDKGLMFLDKAKRPSNKQPASLNKFVDKFSKTKP